MCAVLTSLLSLIVPASGIPAWPEAREISASLEHLSQELIY